MTGWRGKTSCRVYVPRYERHHILRLVNVDPDEGKRVTEYATGVYIGALSRNGYTNYVLYAHTVESVTPDILYSQK